MKLILSLCAKFVALIIMYICIGLMLINSPFAFPGFLIGMVCSFALLIVSGWNEPAGS